MTNVNARSTLAKLGLLSTLYFAQGLPFGFFTQALPVLLRKESFSLGQIGLSSLLAVPWALKFLWAPLVDRHFSPRIGRRRSWIVPLQLAATCILLVVAASGARSLPLLMGAVLLLNLVAATQDIATDGLAVDLTRHSERGYANGVQVAGYRVGMIVGGGVLLILYERLGAATTFASMAAMILLSSIPILLVREPVPSVETTPGLEHDLPRIPHFLRRTGAGRVLVLIVLYKAGDAFATGMLRPFLTDRGLSLGDIGWLLGTVGFVAGMLGALVGGALVSRMERRTALVTFGLLQAASIVGYASAAARATSLPELYVFCAFEHLASGMATAALFTCMMDWCSREASATDYTVQASSVVIATGVASMLSGFSAQALGYFPHFCVAAVLSVVGVIVAGRHFPSEGQLRRITCRDS